MNFFREDAGGWQEGGMFCYFTLLNNVAQTFLWYKNFQGGGGGGGSGVHTVRFSKT